MREPDRIRVESEDDHVVVRVFDHELFDYVDDCFTEQWSLEFSYMTEGHQNDSPVFTMHFAPSVSHSYVSRAVESLPAEEIERIWHLNNP